MSSEDHGDRDAPLYPRPPDSGAQLRPPDEGGPQHPGTEPSRSGVPERVPPHDVITAFQLWLGVIVIGVVIVPLRLVGMVMNIDETTDLFMDQFEQQSALDLTYEQARVWAYVITGVAGVLLLLLLSVLLAVAFTMRRGKPWARVALTAIGVVFGVFAVASVFGSGDGGILSFFDSGLGIVQAVFAAGAIVLMHRDESNRYFTREKHDGNR
ncbi:hypothetical protein [Hoyosella altamirensis]|uniref:Uncharacterized protein n=1 Tax=Hoyosella altamirensis TaxID=616997 RepID=A0A839RM50_9ACTN|nr:hypothetical protein [Hoyosella altamirensis]MBB3037477.1 hypothetical protein [Hoyosella altamirensis]